MEECQPTVASLVSQYRAACAVASGSAQHELEARLGFYNSSSGKFSAAMHPVFFNDVVASFEACKEWSATSEWLETVDVYFTDPVSGQEFRTSICGADVSHCCKKRLHSKFLMCLGQRASISSESGLDVRITVNQETPVAGKDLPPFVNTNHEQRRRNCAC